MTGRPVLRDLRCTGRYASRSRSGSRGRRSCDRAPARTRTAVGPHRRFRMQHAAWQPHICANGELAGYATEQDSLRIEAVRRLVVVNVLELFDDVIHHEAAVVGQHPQMLYLRRQLVGPTRLLQHNLPRRVMREDSHGSAVGIDSSRLTALVFRMPPLYDSMRMITKRSGNPRSLSKRKQPQLGALRPSVAHGAKGRWVARANQGRWRLSRSFDGVGV